MRVAVVGGRLQGVEACYLATKAEWEVILIDKRPETPALNLCHKFYQIDVIKEQKVELVLEQVDLIIPALENHEVLNKLYQLSHKLNKPILYDPKAYAVTSSKKISNELFAREQIPSPKPWPLCDFPIIIKPLGASGSEGVQKINNQGEFGDLKNLLSQQEFIIEEYLEGPSFSIEVIGVTGVYKVFQITELEMDQDYDCKRVLAPAALGMELSGELEEIAIKLATVLNLNGIMDVEVILHQGELKVLEIDARLPSQTPTAVYKSTGVNMLKVLGEALVFGIRVDEEQDKQIKVTPQKIIYEHIKVTTEAIEVLGEHIMGLYGPLKIIPNFFGAEEALTSFKPGCSEWVATLMFVGESYEMAWAKRNAVLDSICIQIANKGAVKLYD